MARERKIRNLWLLYFAADFMALVGAYYTTYALRFQSTWGEGVFNAINQFLGVGRTGSPGETLELFYFCSAPRILLLMALTICVLYALRDLYAERRFLRPRPVAWNIIVANSIALLIFYAYFYLQRNVFHPRSFFGTVLLLNVLYAVVFRSMLEWKLRVLRERFGMDRRKALLVGNSRLTRPLSDYINTLHPHGMRVAGVLEMGGEKPFAGTVRGIEEQVKASGVDTIILADKQLTISQMMEVLDLSDRLDVSVKVLSDKLDILVTRARLPVDMIEEMPLVHFSSSSDSRRFLPLRRALSYIAAILLSLAALPVMAVIALLVAVTSRGAALFVQERIGVNRKPFQMYKFRTMYEKADEQQAQVEEFNEAGGGLFKIRKDPRVTPFGRFLRRFSLDELPQLFNVLMGRMTLVGPRPLPRRDFENYYEDWHYGRHAGLPGLTCLWQVSGRSEIDFHNMCILDVYYLRNQSWVLDLKILLRTIWVVLFAKGAY